VKLNRARVAALGVSACFVATLATGRLDQPLTFIGFVPAGTSGHTQNPFVWGGCQIRYLQDDGASRFQMLIGGLRPGVTYGVKMDGDGAGFSDPLAFTANCFGLATYQHDAPGQAAPNTFVQIYVWDGHDGELINPLDDPDTGARYSTIFDVTDSELRADAVPAGGCGF
jgi:hypothetical protein